MNIWAFGAETEEQIDILFQNRRFRVERIVSTGQASLEGFWYDQEEDEWVLLLTGQAVLEFADKKMTLKGGEQIFIPAHQKHRVAETTKDPACVWICVFAPPERSL